MHAGATSRRLIGQVEATFRRFVGKRLEAASAG